MKRVLMAATVGLFAMQAQAVDYTLTDVIANTPFGPSSLCELAEWGTPCGGSATVNGDAVETRGVQFDFANANSNFNYTGGDWSTTIGGASVIKNAENCEDPPATVPGCASLLGDWTTTADTSVDVTVVGDILRIAYTTPFPIQGLTQTNEYLFSSAPIPVPAAAWLFGSALGLLGWARRRA